MTIKEHKEILLNSYASGEISIKDFEEKLDKYMILVKQEKKVKEELTIKHTITMSQTVKDEAVRQSIEIFGKPNFSGYYTYLVNEKRK